MDLIPSFAAIYIVFGGLWSRIPRQSMQNYPLLPSFFKAYTRSYSPSVHLVWALHQPKFLATVQSYSFRQDFLVLFSHPHSVRVEHSGLAFDGFAVNRTVWKFWNRATKFQFHLGCLWNGNKSDASDTGIKLAAIWIQVFRQVYLHTPFF